MAIPESKPPIRLKPFVPDDGVLVRFEEMFPDAPPTFECLNCQEDLLLRELGIEFWRGEFSVIYPFVPGYLCDTCEKPYFAQGVWNLLTTSAESFLGGYRKGDLVMQVTRVKTPQTEWQPRLPGF